LPRPFRSFAQVAQVALLLLLAACDGGRSGMAFVPEPVPVEGAPARGPADAWVTVVEFADFQCPYCRNVQPTLDLVRSAYGDDLRLVFRHFPLASHARARPAAIAVECAGEQERFWEMSDAVWARTSLGDADLAAAAYEAGVPDLDAWAACLGTEGPAARVDADRALGLEHRVAATPWFFVNGEALAGSRPYAEFQAVVERARDRAVESGIPRASYYDVAVLGK
jgi:protein-disulfide isomerase